MRSKLITLVGSLPFFVLTISVSAADAISKSEEYDKIANELSQYMKAVISLSWQCENEYRRTQNQTNQYCTEAIRQVAQVNMLSKIIPMDDEHLPSGLGKRLSTDYMVSSQRLLDTVKHGDPELTIKTVVPRLADTEGTSSRVVDITFDKVSWVKLNDSEGRELFSGLASGGETITLKGKAPLQLTVGRADAITALNVNNQKFPYHPFVKSNSLKMIIE